MKPNSRYFNQTALMLRLLPHVAEEKCFALKGGTAINFFIREMPRLSVDIDLTYLPIEDRMTSLKNMSAALLRISASIKKAFGHKVQEKRAGGDQRLRKFVVSDGADSVVIEPNEILRGSVFNIQELSVSKSVEDTFEMSATINVLSFADLYGGKFCAALDRQHPRDIFDMKLLMENEGITDEVRKAFVVYAAGHDRPIHELLQPRPIEFRAVFEAEFSEMASIATTYDELVAVRKQYFSVATKALTNRERQFLISLKSGAPEWDLLGIPGLEKLPSLQWKLQNIRKMEKKKADQMLEKLKSVLEV